MTGGWLDGYAEPDDEEENSSPSELTKPTIPSVFTCKHCGTDRLTMKSTKDESVQFSCVKCGKYTTFPAPYGVAKIYRPMCDADFAENG